MMTGRFLNMKQGVASCMGWDYSALAGANSPADLGRSNKLAHKRPKLIAGALFLPAMSLYGGCARDTHGCAGCQLARSANLRTAVVIPCLAASGDGFRLQVGAPFMRHTLTLSPSKARAAAYKAMAFAALYANSSLSVRLARYNAHMTKARSLEVGGVQ